MWKFLDEYWIKFINGYCKVDFLCYNGEPNWLGWIPLIFLGIFLIFVIFLLILIFVKAIMEIVITLVESAKIEITKYIQKIKTGK